MAAETQQSPKLEKLTHTKKYAKMVACGDLYSLPVTAVPGCGFLLGMLLKRENVFRASDLYDRYKTNKKQFGNYLICKFGRWNAVYANTVVRAMEDWEKANVVKPEKKPKREPEEKKKGPPRKVGEGSKKWTAFLLRTDLATTPISYVPGVGSVLSCQLRNRDYRTAKQLMDQYKGEKKGQCKGNEEEFHKWVLCCFGYWNTLYSKTVVAALKAYDEGHDGATPLLVPVEPKVEPQEESNNDNENQGPAPGQQPEATFKEMLIQVAEKAAEEVSEALNSIENGNKEETKEEEEK